jgi:hypothetical protein
VERLSIKPARNPVIFEEETHDESKETATNNSHWSISRNSEPNPYPVIASTWPEGND